MVAALVVALVAAGPGALRHLHVVEKGSVRCSPEEGRG